MLTLPTCLGRGALIPRQGWGTTWDIPLEQDQPIQPTHGKKLLKWINEDRRRGSDVQETLYAISDIFADTNNLEKKYGVVITPKDVVSHGSDLILSKETNQ